MISDGTCGPENSIPMPATFMIELPLIEEINTKPFTEMPLPG